MTTTPPATGAPWPTNAEIVGQFAAGPSFVQWHPMELPGGLGVVMVLHTPSTVAVSFWDEPSCRHMLDRGYETIGGLHKATDADVLRLLRPDGTEQ